MQLTIKFELEPPNVPLASVRGFATGSYAKLFEADVPALVREGLNQPLFLKPRNIGDIMRSRHFFSDDSDDLFLSQIFKSNHNTQYPSYPIFELAAITLCPHFLRDVGHDMGKPHLAGPHQSHARKKRGRSQIAFRLIYAGSTKTKRYRGSI